MAIVLVSDFVYFDYLHGLVGTAGSDCSPPTRVLDAASGIKSGQVRQGKAGQGRQGKARQAK